MGTPLNMENTFQGLHIKKVLYPKEPVTRSSDNFMNFNEIKCKD